MTFFWAGHYRQHLSLELGKMPLAWSFPSAVWAPGKMVRSWRLGNLFAKRTFWKATREELYVVTPSNLRIPFWGIWSKKYFKGTDQRVQLMVVYWDKMAMDNRPLPIRWMEDHLEMSDSGRLRPQQVREWKSWGPTRKLWGTIRQSQNENYKLGAWLGAPAHE